MSNSPFLPNDVKEYLQSNSIQQNLNSILNSLLKSKAKDPFSFLSSEFAKLSKSTVDCVKLNAHEILLNDGNPALQVVFTLIYQNQTFVVSSNINHSKVSENDSNVVYDDDQKERFNGFGMTKALNLVDQQISQLLNTVDLQNQKNVDQLLLTLYEENNQRYINSIYPVSFSLPKLISSLQNQQTFQYVRKTYQPNEHKNFTPDLIINLLQGQSLVGSKCKVFKYQLFVNVQENPSQYLVIVQNIANLIKKNICSGKGGEAALKFHTDGSIICPADTIMDNLKIVEDAINASGYADKVSIVSTKVQQSLILKGDVQKYELENPKALFDADGLIDYYFKLCSDKPLIKYLEDPLFSGDIKQWIKMTNKFQAINVKIGSRFLYKNEQSINDLTEEKRVEDGDGVVKDLLFLNYTLVQIPQYPTLTQFLELWKNLSNKGINIIIQETNAERDTVQMDLAFGLKNCSVCVALPLKYEKLQKLNYFVELAQLSKI